MNLDLLPQGARDIVHAMGVSDAITVLSTLAGTKWEVPRVERKSNRSGSQLIAHLGEPLALRLMAAFGGETLSIPRCQKALNAVRDQAIVTRFEELCREGLSVRLALSELALQYHLTTAYVWRIVNRIEDAATHDVSQLSLF